jgi:hypothetical protein
MRVRESRLRRRSADSSRTRQESGRRQPALLRNRQTSLARRQWPRQQRWRRRRRQRRRRLQEPHGTRLTMRHGRDVVYRRPSYAGVVQTDALLSGDSSNSR